MLVFTSFRCCITGTATFPDHRFTMFHLRRRLPLLGTEGLASWRQIGGLVSTRLKNHVKISSQIWWSTDLPKSSTRSEDCVVCAVLKHFSRYLLRAIFGDYAMYFDPLLKVKNQTKRFESNLADLIAFTRSNLPSVCSLFWHLRPKMTVLLCAVQKIKAYVAARRTASVFSFSCSVSRRVSTIAGRAILPCPVHKGSIENAL